MLTRRAFIKGSLATLGAVFAGKACSCNQIAASSRAVPAPSNELVSGIGRGSPALALDFLEMRIDLTGLVGADLGEDEILF